MTADNLTLLYVTFVDMNGKPTSGSSVRPQRMLEAFNELDVNIILLGGYGGRANIKQRKTAVRAIEQSISRELPDICYIEPPSGPMFCSEDLKLIRQLHAWNVPIGLFYRDAYWKHPEYSVERRQSSIEKAKTATVAAMQRRQWRVFDRCCSMIYFPSDTMGKEFGKAAPCALPPGTFIPEGAAVRSPEQTLHFLFVGGAAKNHGTLLTLDAFRRVNTPEVRCTLTYVCPKDQWEALSLESMEVECRDWLTVVHASGDAELKQYYQRADVALLTAPRTRYRDFAVPIKVFEYMSYLKPMLVTNCTETARIVSGEGVGWVVEDTVEGVESGIERLIDHPNEILEKQANLLQARYRNLWRSRAERVISDLMEVRG